MSNDELVETIRKKFERVSTVLDERGRRVWALAEAEALGYGGQSIVAKATGLSRMTLYSENAVMPRTTRRVLVDTSEKQGVDARS